jgi:glutamyl-Q tRNA(Asp) synthetase
VQPVFRFAPSPNGYLHLGHAYSALLNDKLARESGGRFLLRIEDIDTVRCRPELVEAVFEDLNWLGLRWEEPVMHQSAEFGRYLAALDDLAGRGLVYPCFCTRKDISAAVATLEATEHSWPRDPDGAPVYPGCCRALVLPERSRRLAEGRPYALRLDSARALASLACPDLFWEEQDTGPVRARSEIWGDVVLARKETPTSYHLAVVLDDARQGVTDVVRGRDLYAATAIHRLLQTLLGLPAPRYRHHALITDETGGKLAKSRISKPIRSFRAEGVSASELRLSLGF